MAPGGVGIPTGVLPGKAPFGGRMVVGGVGFTPGSPGGGGIITESLDGVVPFGIWVDFILFKVSDPCGSAIGLKPGAKDVVGIPRLGAPLLAGGSSGTPEGGCGAGIS